MNYLLAAVEFKWYGFLIGLAMLICIAAAYYLAKKRGYNADIVFNIAAICLPCAILGARIYYIAFDIMGGGGTVTSWFLPRGSFTLRKFIGFVERNGGWEYEGLAGLAIYGGLIAAALGAIIVRLINKRDKNPSNRMTYIQMLDAFFVLILLGQAIGRWGNFANDEAYGNMVTNPDLQWFPYAYNSSTAGGWVQATFFWESMANVIGFAVLLYLCYGKKRSYDGFIFSGYCLWYGLVRAIIEGQRSDSLYISVKSSSVLGVLMLLAAVALVSYGVVTQYRAAKSQGRGLVIKDGIKHIDLYMFSLFMLVFGLIAIISGNPIRISQLVSGLLISWGASNVAGHIIKAKFAGKKPLIFVPMDKLGLEYYGYDQTIMYINKMYDKDGNLKAETGTETESGIADTSGNHAATENKNED